MELFDGRHAMDFAPTLTDWLVWTAAAGAGIAALTIVARLLDAALELDLG